MILAYAVQAKLVGTDDWRTVYLRIHETEARELANGIVIVGPHRNPPLQTVARVVA